MNIYFICGFSAVCCVAGCVIRELKPEIMPLFFAVAGCVILGFAIEYLSPVIAELTSVASTVGVGGWFSLVLKALAGTMGCSVCADLCRDCGESAIATKVEFAGRVYVLALCLPLVRQLLELTEELLT